jgi:hypothetical protein
MTDTGRQARNGSFASGAAGVALKPAGFVGYRKPPPGVPRSHSFARWSERPIGVQPPVVSSRVKLFVQLPVHVPSTHSRVLPPKPTSSWPSSKLDGEVHAWPAPSITLFVQLPLQLCSNCISANDASPPTPSMIRCSAHFAPPIRFEGKPGQRPFGSARNALFAGTVPVPKQVLLFRQLQSFCPPLHHDIDPDVSTITRKYGLT